jgi:hypothetical protein
VARGHAGAANATASRHCAAPSAAISAVAPSCQALPARMRQAALHDARFSRGTVSTSRVSCRHAPARQPVAPRCGSPRARPAARGRRAARPAGRGKRAGQADLVERHAHRQVGGHARAPARRCRRGPARATRCSSSASRASASMWPRRCWRCRPRPGPPARRRRACAARARCRWPGACCCRGSAPRRCGGGEQRDAFVVELDAVRVPHVVAQPAQVLGVLGGGAVELLAAVGDVVVVFGQVGVQPHARQSAAGARQRSGFRASAPG